MEKTENQKINIDEDKKKKKSEEKNMRDPGIGIDVGTGNLVVAESLNQEASFKLQRDAFLDIEDNKMSRNMLDKLKANYIQSDNELFIIGEEALQVANFFNKDARRPLSHGCISTREKNALSMIKVILKNLLGDPVKENETCYFSVPAAPIDQENFNVVYHENILKTFISSFGFSAQAINEAFAIIWSELEDENYTGMAISFGAGMTNVCLSFMGTSEKEHQFSFARGGDFIDSSSAEAVGLKASRITVIKEAGVDLLNPKTREETAIKIYYDNLIKYVCDGMETKFNNSSTIPNFPEPIVVILSGGTAKAINFEKVFETEIKKKNLPFKIKSVQKAKDQLNSVAQGCLLNALG